MYHLSLFAFRSLIVIFGDLVVVSAVMFLVIYINSSIERHLLKKVNYYLHSQSPRGITFAAKTGKIHLEEYTRQLRICFCGRQESVYLEVTFLDSTIEETPQQKDSKEVEPKDTQMPSPCAPEMDTSEYVNFQYFSSDPAKI